VPGDVLELWGQTVSYLNQRNTKGRSQVGIYLKYLTPEILSDSELVVSTDNSFAKTWIERHYFSDIKDAIFNVVGIDYGFRIVVSGKENAAKAVTTYQQNLNRMADEPAQTQASSSSPSFSTGSPDNLITPPLAAGSALPSVSAPSPITSPTSPMMTPSFAPTAVVPLPVDPFEQRTTITTDERTFESFIVGDSNRYAFSAALGVAKSPGNIYNPLFIYGESGLGKTHLLLAIENYIKIHQPHLKTTYVQTSDLVRDFTAMLYDDDKKRQFELKYHHVDVVLFDDVQSLEGKIETTSEVFQIFNHFKAQNKQIVLSADRAPKDIDLDARYKSRFASGITIDIQPPTFETKQAIFENYFEYSCHKIGRLDMKEMITQEICDRIIELSTDNIRELEGATASLVAYLSARQNMFDTLTIEEVERRISSVFMRSEEKRVDINSIQREIESFYSISHDDLLGEKRSQGISYPRQVAMYLSRSMTGKSYPDIGKAFGGKDHTTAMYAYNKIEKKRQLSRETDREIERLVALLKK
jgi:chromosomal replication initiator protein